MRWVYLSALIMTETICASVPELPREWIDPQSLVLVRVI